MKPTFNQKNFSAGNNTFQSQAAKGFTNPSSNSFVNPSTNIPNQSNGFFNQSQGFPSQKKIENNQASGFFNQKSGLATNASSNATFFSNNTGNNFNFAKKNPEPGPNSLQAQF